MIALFLHLKNNCLVFCSFKTFFAFICKNLNVSSDMQQICFLKKILENSYSQFICFILFLRLSKSFFFICCFSPYKEQKKGLFCSLSVPVNVSVKNINQYKLSFHTIVNIISETKEKDLIFLFLCNCKNNNE